MVAIPFLLEGLGFWAVNNPFFERHADFFYVAAQNSLFATRNKHCDVIIFGDSTAMAGLDPAAIQRQTGLKACNVAVTQATLDIVGLDPLDRYLARNPRPQILLLQFSPHAFRRFPYDSGHAEAEDGFVLVLRHYGWGRVMAEIVRHPDYIFMVPQYAYVDGPKQLLANMIYRKPIASADGSYIVLPRSTGVPCAPSGAYLIPNTSWVRQLRESYADKADRVVVNVAPISSCNPHFEKWAAAFQGLTDNSLAGYPDNLFADVAAHTNRAGATRLSEETSRQLLAIEGSPQRSTVASQ